jgi:hypothetical protein
MSAGRVAKVARSVLTKAERRCRIPRGGTGEEAGLREETSAGLRAWRLDRLEGLAA